MITKFKVFEYNELDPYDEEDDWNPREKETIKKGDIVKCINPFGYNGELSTKLNYEVKFVGFGFPNYEKVVLKTLDGKNKIICGVKVEDIKKKKEILENFNDVDPWGEEDWDDGSIKVKILPKFKDFIYKFVRSKQQKKWLEIIGKICDITGHTKIMDYDCYTVKLEGFEDYYDFIVPKDCVEKVDTVLENHNDIDPWGEENWDNKTYTMKDLNVGDKLYLNNMFYGQIVSIQSSMIKFKDKNSLVGGHTWFLTPDVLLDALNNERLRIEINT